ncbi:MAG: cobalamin biosynthesis protein CobQ [Pseudomonadota bacterium]
MVLGALAPDISMFVFFAWSRLQGWTGHETWNVQYWNEPWQTMGAVSNSFLLFAGLYFLAALRAWKLALVFAIASLLHLALDFPLHADDAHRHFWPLTDWRFFSPVSYWDPNAKGVLGSAIESLCVLFATVILWQRFPQYRWRALFVGLALLQGLAFAAQFAWSV